MKKKILAASLILIVLIILSGVFADRTNPAVRNTVAWDSAETCSQFMKSCADCHSHETRWPWYAHVGPSAFLVTHHVEEGREHFNISRPKMGDADEAAEEVMKGKMPPRDYLLLHPEAGMSDAQKQQFAKGLIATFGGESGDSHEQHGEHDDDD